MDTKEAKAPASAKLEKIHETALKQFDRALQSDEHNREHGLECAEFAVGNQWPDEIKQKREAEGRPCITINRAPAIMRQVTNEVRIRPPSIEVLPAEDGDVETATVLEGLIRSIENTSKAKRIYAKTMEDAARCGMGFWRILTGYKDEDSFDQDIFLQHIENPFSVLVDPDGRDPMGSDWQFAFVLDAMTKDRFHEVYGDDATHGIAGDNTTNTDGNGGGAHSNSWVKGDLVQVAEYFMYEKEDRTLVILDDGTVLDAEEYDEAANSYNDALQRYQEAVTLQQQDIQTAVQQAVAQGADPQQALAQVSQTQPTIEEPEAPPSVIVDEETGEPRTRETVRKKVVSYIMSGKEILSGPHEHACNRIPIVPTWGEVYRVADKKVRQCVISNMMEPARMMNYWRSASVEAIALAPKAPWLYTPKQVEGFESIWRTVGQGNPAGLPYNPDPKVPGGQPTRVAPAPVQSAMLQEAAIAADDIKAATGIYDASLGARSNETSGRAIQARQAEGDVSTYVYLDNLLHAVEETGRIIVSMIPRIYDTPRTIRILGKKEEAKIVKVNDGGQFDLRIGKYDVSISTGASFSTRRQEAAQMLTEVLRTSPNLAPILIPRLLDVLELPDGKEIVAEVKQLLQGSGPPPPDPKDVAQAQKYIAEAQESQMDTHVKGLELQLHGLPTPQAPGPQQGGQAGPNPADPALQQLLGADA